MIANQARNNKRKITLLASAGGDFPAGLSNPARRALAAANCFTLDQAAKLGEKELLRLHGFGPKGLEILREALREKGLKFSD